MGLLRDVRENEEERHVSSGSNPTGNLGLTVLAALIPVVVLLVMLAVFRITAWLATLIGSILTLIVAIALWHLPLGTGIQSYFIGSANGVWAVDWITFWGVVIFNTLKLTGLFDTFKNWLVEQATADVRVQTILLAWALGALLEGLVGFGYPWAVVAPILVALGVFELDALRVAAIANNAPVSFGALGAPIIALAAVTNLPLYSLSASVGKIVAVLALLPPWVLIYLVTGRKGFREGWPLAVVGSLAFILGQFPVSQFLGPYLPDIVGALALLWRYPSAIEGLAAKDGAGLWGNRAERRRAEGANHLCNRKPCRKRKSHAPAFSLSGVATIPDFGGGGRAVDWPLVSIAEGRGTQLAGQGYLVYQP